MICARLDKLKMEAIHSGRIAPVIDFFDSLNVMVWNAFRVNLPALVKLPKSTEIEYWKSGRKNIASGIKSGINHFWWKTKEVTLYDQEENAKGVSVR